VTQTTWQPTADQAALIHRLRAEGAGFLHIAAVVGVGAHPLTIWMQRHGMKALALREQRFPSALRDLILLNIAAGKEPAAIARTLGLTESIVRAQADRSPTPDAAVHHPLTTDERRTLRRALERPIRMTAAARTLGTTVRGLRGRLTATGTTFGREQRQAVLERIDADLRAGRSVPAIARDLGRTENDIVQWAHKAGWRWPRIAPEVLRMHTQGATVESIAETVGRTVQTIRTVLLFYGHKPHTAWRRRLESNAAH